MQIDLITSADGMESLRAEWSALVADSDVVSPFMTWEWQFFWWKHYGDDQALRVVVARDGGRLVGVLPLYIGRRRVLRGLLPLRILQQVGAGGDTVPDYLDPPMRASHAQRLSAELATFVVQAIGGWDELRMCDLRAHLPFTTALEGACRARGWPTTVSPSARISYLPLPPTWEEYLKSVSRERRYKIRSIRRKFEELPGARFYAWSDGTRLDAAIDRLIELHRLRWQDRSERHAFSSEAYRGFHRELMHAFWQRGWLVLYCLEIEGRIVMMFYCYRLRGVTYHFQTGFDPAWARSRPGHVMMGYLVESEIAGGGSEFDMLRGQYDFKDDYARDTRQTLTVAAARTRPARWVGLARDLRADLIKRRLEAQPA
jgi:CelD/BcsL family acetyltransferase involved in cellulose biosynthesis